MGIYLYLFSTDDLEIQGIIDKLYAAFIVFIYSESAQDCPLNE
jgi:hypothetical protein